jgi:hypothetical protein
MEDSSRRLIWDCRLTIVDCRFAKCPALWRAKTLVKVRTARSLIANRQSRIDNCQGAVALRDVKNEGRSGYVYENTGNDDKMSGYKTGFCTKMHPRRENRQRSVGILAENAGIMRKIGAKLEWSH